MAKTTPEERKEYIRRMRYGKVGFPVSMSFIDRKGNIVRPSREDFESKKRPYVSKSQYASDYKTALKLDKQYNAMVDKYGKDSTQVYQFETEKLGMYRKRKASPLEGGLAVIGIAGGLLFLSPNITGNAVGLSHSTGNLLGAVLLVAGLVSSFLFFMHRKS
jgi:hypothetical protein